MLGYAILSALLVIAVAGWIHRWYRYQVLVAYLALKKVPEPTVEELEKCSRVVRRYWHLRMK